MAQLAMRMRTRLSVFDLLVVPLSLSFSFLPLFFICPFALSLLHVLYVLIDAQNSVLENQLIVQFIFLFFFFCVCVSFFHFFFFFKTFSLIRYKIIKKIKSK